MFLTKQTKSFVLVGCSLIVVYLFCSIYERFIFNDCKYAKSKNLLDEMLKISTIKQQAENNQRNQNKYQPKQSIKNFKSENEMFNKAISLEKWNFFGCQDFVKLFVVNKSREENILGSKGISFITAKINGNPIPVVYKQANSNSINNGTKFSEFYSKRQQYKYNMAMSELKNLKVLNGLPGIPKLFGSCVTNQSVEYVVERIRGLAFCNDNGTTPECYNASFLMNFIENTNNPSLSSLKLTYSIINLFRVLEEQQLFFEDLTGVNLMFTPNFDVFLVDADSLINHKESRLMSQLKCNNHDECSGPIGNLWSKKSLNVRIYANCLDLYGFCDKGRCHGFDAGLHACGLAEWFICKLVKFFSHLPKLQEEFESICLCMRTPNPKQRCSFLYVQAKLQRIIANYKSAIS